MNLKLIKSVKDDGTHFTVDHATRGTFPVVKRGLDNQTLSKIQALCTGGVAGYASGGDVDLQMVPDSALTLQPPPGPAAFQGSDSNVDPNGAIRYGYPSVSAGQAMLPAPGMMSSTQNSASGPNRFETVAGMGPAAIGTGPGNLDRNGRPVQEGYAVIPGKSGETGKSGPTWIPPQPAQIARQVKIERKAPLVPINLVDPTQQFRMNAYSRGGVVHAFNGAQIPEMVSPEIPTMGSATAGAPPGVQPYASQPEPDGPQQALPPGSSAFAQDTPAPAATKAPPPPPPPATSAPTTQLKPTEVKAPGLGGMQRVADEEKAANARGAGIDTAMYNEQAANEAQTQRHIEEATAAGNAAVQKAQNGVNSLRTDILNSKIDPNRLWHNTSTGGKIASTIGILLSGIGSGFLKQPNMALQTLDKMIDQDIESQKMELGKKQTMLGDNLKEVGDMRLATNMLRMQMLTDLKTRNDAIATKYAGGKAQAATQAFGAGIDQKMEELKLQQGNLTYQQKLAEAKERDQRNRAMNIAAGIGTDEDHLLSSPEERKLHVFTSSGHWAAAPDEKSAGEVREGQNTLSNISSTLDRMDQLRKEGLTGIGTETVKRRADFDSLEKNLQLSIGHYNGLSRVTETELGLSPDIFPSRGNFYQSWKDDAQFAGKMDAVRNTLMQKRANLENAYLSAKPR